MPLPRRPLFGPSALSMHNLERELSHTPPAGHLGGSLHAPPAGHLWALSMYGAGWASLHTPPGAFSPCTTCGAPVGSLHVPPGVGCLSTHHLGGGLSIHHLGKLPPCTTWGDVSTHHLQDIWGPLPTYHRGYLSPHTPWGTISTYHLQGTWGALFTHHLMEGLSPHTT